MINFDLNTTEKNIVGGVNELAPYKVGKIDPNSDGTGEVFNYYINNKATGNYSHAEGYSTEASGNGSHAEGYYTIASTAYAHAEGKYNFNDPDAIHMVGIGTSYSDRKNAMVIHDDGSIYINGIGGYSGTTTSGAQSLQEVIASLLSR